MSHAVFDTYRPDGFTSVNPYLFTENPSRLIDFLKKVFYAEEQSRTLSSEGIIRNCILKIGDSGIMIAQANGPFMGMRTALYLYVNDVEGIYQRAMEQGAHSVFEASDMDYGDRQAGIIDLAGNYWWISQRLEQAAYQPDESTS